MQKSLTFIKIRTNFIIPRIKKQNINVKPKKKCNDTSQSKQ